MVQDTLSVVVFGTFLRRAVKVLRFLSKWKEWGQVLSSWAEGLRLFSISSWMRDSIEEVGAAWHGVGAGGGGEVAGGGVRHLSIFFLQTVYAEHTGYH